MTMILKCSIEMPNISYAWKELKEQLGEEIDSKVKGMVFLKGKQVRKAGSYFVTLLCGALGLCGEYNTVQYFLPV